MAGWIAPVAAAAGGAASGIAGSITSGVMGTKNLEFQKEQFEYQKAMNDKYMERMDNRLQYMAKDAKKAGINPLAALGQSGGYTPLNSAPAPQYDVKPLVESLKSFGSIVSDSILTAKAFQDLQLARSQQNLVDQQVLTEAGKTAITHADKKRIEAGTNQIVYNTKYAQENSAPTGVMPDVERSLVVNASKVLDTKGTMERFQNARDKKKAMNLFDDETYTRLKQLRNSLGDVDYKVHGEAVLDIKKYLNYRNDLRYKIFRSRKEYKMDSGPLFHMFK